MPCGWRHPKKATPEDMLTITTESYLSWKVAEIRVASEFYALVNTGWSPSGNIPLRRDNFVTLELLRQRFTRSRLRWLDFVESTNHLGWPGLTLHTSRRGAPSPDSVSPPPRSTLVSPFLQPPFISFSSIGSGQVSHIPPFYAHLSVSSQHSRKSRWIAKLIVVHTSDQFLF